MAVQAKICGINDAAAMQAAVEGGAAFVGLVFYAPSPRNVTPAEAQPLASLVPPDITRVGLFVDADDALIAAAHRDAALDMLQLHGSESPARCDELRERHGTKIMKVLKVAEEHDLEAAQAYFDHADWLMFDAKPPASMKDALPGGNALAFEWALLAGRAFPLPWMLAGGLTPDNVAEAARISGASTVDVSSGVEKAPGRKDPDKIARFLATVRAL